MKALTVVPLKAGSAELSDIDEPPESDGPVLVETLAVGICGTDIEILSGAYGWAPPGPRAPGPRPRVAGPRARGAGRRAGGQGRPGGRHRAPARPGALRELRRAGVGLLPQRAVHRARHQGARRLSLRALPDHARLRGQGRPRLGILGVLLEPTSVVAKAWEEVDRVGGRAHWDPKTVAGHRGRADRPARRADRRPARARRARASTR